jgi:hypothetical protein
MRHLTTELMNNNESAGPKAPTNTGESRQYGRCEDVERIYGLKRGTVYNLLKAAKIRGASIVVSGTRRRTLLIDLVSVRQFVESQMPRKEVA